MSVTREPVALPRETPPRPKPMVVNRRVLARSAVWTMPAVLAASAAPALAASSGALLVTDFEAGWVVRGTIRTQITYVGTDVAPGGTEFVFVFQNLGSTTISPIFDSSAATINGSPTYPVTLAPGEMVSLTITTLNDMLPGEFVAITYGFPGGGNFASSVSFGGELIGCTGRVNGATELGLCPIAQP